MIAGSGKHRWHMLPGGDWPTARDGRIWLKRERERLGWTSKDIEKKFLDVAHQSDLYIGVGGGDCFDRPTVARMRRFEDGGETIPDWLYWSPLVIARESVPGGERWDWDQINISAHRRIREDQERADFYEHTPYLDDDQLELVARYNDLAPHLRPVLLEMAGMPDLIEALSKQIAKE